MKEYIIFLDESGDHNLIKIDPQYPVFTLVGCIFEIEYYDSVAVPKIEELKAKHFGSTDIVLHSYEIRKNKDSFQSLFDQEKRRIFIEDMNILLSDLQYTIISSCIRKNDLVDMYSDPVSPYDLSFQFILERFVKFLKVRNGQGKFSFESRDRKSNTELHNIYDSLRTGSKFVSSQEFQKYILGIEFVEKSKNMNGHQIADLIAYPISRYCLDKESKTNYGWDIIKSKFRKSGNKIEGYGYKEFP